MSTTINIATGEIKPKPSTFKDLANMYNVTPRTFKKWIEPHLRSLGKRNSRYFTVKQVRIIFERLGEP